MEKVFFGRVRRVGSDDETVLSVRNPPLVLQPFGCERRLFFREFRGKPDFFISRCEGKIFSGEIKVGSQGGQFAFHCVSLYLNEKFVSGPERRVPLPSGCINCPVSLAEGHVAFLPVGEPDKSRADIGGDLLRFSHIDIAENTFLFKRFQPEFLHFIIRDYCAHDTGTSVDRHFTNDQLTQLFLPTPPEV